MTLRHLKIFVAVCKWGGVTAAAEKLYLAQPSVSLAIRELEEHYGLTLFDRVGRRLTLTQAGKRFLEAASAILEAFDELESRAKDFDRYGLLRVGSSITIANRVLPGLVSAFTAANPGARTEVTVDNSAQIERKIAENRLDVALIEGTPHSPRLSATPLWDDELVCICSPRHPFAKRQAITLSELAANRLLLRERGSGTRELLEGVMLANDLTVSPLWESVSTQALAAAVAENLGVSVLPRQLVARDIEMGTVLPVPIENVSLIRKFYLIRHRGKYLSRLAEDFIALCKSLSKAREPDTPLPAPAECRDR